MWGWGKAGLIDLSEVQTAPEVSSQLGAGMTSMDPAMQTSKPAYVHRTFGIL